MQREMSDLIKLNSKKSSKKKSQGPGLKNNVEEQKGEDEENDQGWDYNQEDDDDWGYGDEDDDQIKDAQLPSLGVKTSSYMGK